mgnify:CR=1 FL=1
MKTAIEFFKPHGFTYEYPGVLIADLDKSDSVIYTIGVENEAFHADVKASNTEFTVQIESTDGEMLWSAETPVSARAALLAYLFIVKLREEISVEDFREVCVRNVTYEPGICASHDFCDANEVMLAAWAAIEPKITFEPNDDGQTAVWNDAWAVAKEVLGSLS